MIFIFAAFLFLVSCSALTQKCPPRVDKTFFSDVYADMLFYKQLYQDCSKETVEQDKKATGMKERIRLCEETLVKNQAQLEMCNVGYTATYEALLQCEKK